MGLSDTIWAGIGFILTIMVLSYVIGDNILFRLATHLFIGVAAAYITLIALYQIIIPNLIIPLLRGNIANQSILLIPLLLSVMLLCKISPRLAWLGNIPMAYLVGAGAAVAIGGAVLGTIIPQVQASTDLFDLRQGTMLGQHPAQQIFIGVLVILGTISTLAYFNFTGKNKENHLSGRMLKSIRKIGQIFIAITFGVLFASIYMTALTALVDRLSSVVDFVEKLIWL
jgi:hypothetical protein